MPYNKTTWATGDLITAAKLTNLETQYDTTVQQPRCAVYHTSNQTITGGAAALAWNSEDYDSHSMHDTVTNNSRITIPSGWGGRYLVVANVTWESFAQNRALFLKVNGATYVGTIIDYPNSVDYRQILTCLVSLSASDYLELEASQQSGSNKTLYSRANSYFNMYWSVNRIGDT